MKRKSRRKGSIIVEVAILFLIGILVTGILTNYAETRRSNSNVTAQTEFYAEQISAEVRRVVEEFPAHPWLIRYWYEHADQLDIEYDADFSPGSRTAAKCRTLLSQHPGLELRYMDQQSLLTLSDEEQKLYAEIAYSWLITHIDQIKLSYHVDYLFCVITQPPYTEQFFLFSGADPGAKRGTNYEEVYPLGHTVSVGASQEAAMRSAALHSSYLADAGDYVDYYARLSSLENHVVLIGLTYNFSGLRADMKSQARSGTLTSILYMFLLAVLCLGLILLFVLRPLRKVQKNIRLYAETKDSVPVVQAMDKIRSRNEIGVLAEDVAALTCELDAHMAEIRTITAEKERIGAELTLARRIQGSMLPNTFPAFPDRAEFDIYAAMDPAKEVGGDFYDFFLVDDDHLCMMIADVSGKGVPAALFMMASRIILANNAMMGRSPAEILYSANMAICDKNPEEMFVTVWLGILELSTGRLTAANAGHEYPVLKTPGGVYEPFRDKHGFVLGGMPGMRYKEYELMLEPGAKLFVYTDGVPEATSAELELFGMERMLSALNQKPDAAPEQTLANVRAAVDGFVRGAEQFDDLTMLCLEYRGKQQSQKK